jgi:hypothetical protein
MNLSPSPPSVIILMPLAIDVSGTRLIDNPFVVFAGTGIGAGCGVAVPSRGVPVASVALAWSAAAAARRISCCSREGAGGGGEGDGEGAGAVVSGSIMWSRRRLGSCERKAE